MAVQVVMDHSGDTAHWYDTNDERIINRRQGKVQATV